MMKRKRYVIIIAVLAAIFSVSTFFLIRNHIDSKKQAEIYDELIETVEDTDETQETMSYSEDQSFLPDYQELFLQNNDMVGWIKVEDTKINYPVMQSKEEPNFYLRHGFDKAYTVYGCPYDRNYEPKAGDIIFFDWGGDGATDHVGIVEKCENGTVYTVEGNSGDACKQRTYAVGSSSIYGYGIPAY